MSHAWMSRDNRSATAWDFRISLARSMPDSQLSGHHRVSDSRGGVPHGHARALHHYPNEVAIDAASRNAKKWSDRSAPTAQQGQVPTAPGGPPTRRQD